MTIELKQNMIELLQDLNLESREFLMIAIIENGEVKELELTGDLPTKLGYVREIH